MATRLSSLKNLGQVVSSSSTPSGTSSMLPKILVTLLLVIVVAAGSLFAFFYYRNSRNEKANVTCYQAVKMYQAPLAQDGVAADLSVGVTQYKTAKERAEASLKALDECTQAYPNATFAPLLDVVRGGILFDQNRLSDAEPLYRKQSDTTTFGIVQAIGVDGLAVIFENQNKKQEAAALYKRGADQGVSFYRPFFDWGQARLFFEQKNAAKAIEVYKRLSQLLDWSMPYRNRIQNRLIELE